MSRVPRGKVKTNYIEPAGMPFLILSKLEDGAVESIVMTDVFENVGEWGVCIADLLQHVANAYSKQGHDYALVHAEVKDIILKELANPTEMMKIGHHKMFGMKPIEE